MLHLPLAARVHVGLSLGAGKADGCLVRCLVSRSSMLSMADEYNKAYTDAVRHCLLPCISIAFPAKTEPLNFLAVIR